MPPVVRFMLGLLLVVLTRPAFADDAPAADRIAWSADLPTALVKAKDSKRVLFVCINARKVDGRADEEPAAKGLREVVYVDPRVVKRSLEFVCVLLDGGAAKYDALHALGVENPIVSPQHLFIRSEGDRILLRRPYWSHGSGEKAVEKLLELMDDALRASKDPGPAPGVVAGGAPAPEGADARGAWMAERLEKLAGGADDRAAIVKQLMDADRNGDCASPLIAFLTDKEKDVGLLRLIVRALGRDGLEAAALPIAALLDHKDDGLVANAAVSLEYIGSPDKKVIAALRKVADRAKEELLANHAYRALGRCGAKDGAVRDLLLDRASSGKSEFATYGPCVGLAYFEGDEKAMRGVEKLLKQIGVPGSRRGGGQNTVKRGLLSWTLASIGNAKSGKFVREELIAGLEHVKAFWVDGLVTFWDGVARVCEGDKTAMPGVEAGVGVFVKFATEGDLGRYGAEVRSLTDDARKGRDPTGFKPKGEGLLDSDK